MTDRETFDASRCGNVDDGHRVVLAVDMDCFYAQVVQEADPTLHGTAFSFQSEGLIAIYIPCLHPLWKSAIYLLGQLVGLQFYANQSVALHTNCLQLPLLFAHELLAITPSICRTIGKPVAVRQKWIVVTCNYEARARGVKKLQALNEATRVCPGQSQSQFHLSQHIDVILIFSPTLSCPSPHLIECIIVDGSDLTNFRIAAKKINQLISDVVGIDCPLERLG
jgi:hypothetical protein